MKILNADPNNTVKIIDKTDEAANEYGINCGYDLIELKKEHIKALQSSKMLAWDNDKYSTFVVLDVE